MEDERGPHIVGADGSSEAEFLFKVDEYTTPKKETNKCNIPMAMLTTNLT
jgi:hypothetical protein